MKPTLAIYIAVAKQSTGMTRESIRPNFCGQNFSTTLQNMVIYGYLSRDGDMYTAVRAPAGLTIELMREILQARVLR